MTNNGDMPWNQPPDGGRHASGPSGQGYGDGSQPGSGTPENPYAAPPASDGGNPYGAPPAGQGAYGATGGQGTYGAQGAAGTAPAGTAPAGSQAPSRMVCGLLGIFLGGWGVHRFLMGYTTMGIIQIVVTLVTCGMGSIWGLIEGILILTKSPSFMTDAHGRPLTD